LPTQETIQALNSWANWISFAKTEQYQVLDKLPHRCIALFAGNRSGKTASVAKHYVDRLIGKASVPYKNKLMGKVRCMSSSLPESNDPDVTDNAQYIELRRLIPSEMIIKDVTARSANLVVRRPVGLSSKKTVFEFRSSKQEMQDLGKINLSSLWHDEETPDDKRTECAARLMQEDGDEIFSITTTNPYCFDEETELLTNRGWKFYDEILMSDEIMTHNKMGYMEWKKLEGFHVYKYKGNLTHLWHKSFDAAVTPNHKWLVSNTRNQAKWYLEETKNLNSKHIIKRIEHTVLGDDNEEYSDELIALLGWLVTDGSVARQSVVITQSLTANGKKCNDIDVLAADFNVKVTDHPYPDRIINGREVTKNGICRRWSFRGEDRKRMLSFVEVTGYKKSLSQEFICSLSKRQLKILYNAIIDGDGNRGNGGSIRIAQVENPKLMDNFQLIATLLGKLASRSEWYDKTRDILFNKAHVYSDSSRFRKNTHIKSLNVKSIPYNGFVWCPTTSNKTTVVRRNGCVSISGNSYVYDEVFVPASYVYRTKKVIAHTGEERVEKRLKGNTDIACIIMSTYDNPTLSEDAIQRMIDKCADPVQVDLRIYGTFRQASGRIHKTYNPKYCFIPFTRYFPDGIPYEWFHCRGIDYHESRTPWSVGWMALSPTNEAFLWQEFHPAIDGPNAYNTYDICKTIARNSQEFIYTVNLIDALANKKQANSGFSTTDDMNRHFHEMRRTSGIGAQCFWEGWNTKGTTGRDNVSLRFKNAVRCGKPFNNKVREAGRVSYLPTLWICDTAPKFHHSIMNWRYGEYVTSTTRAVNDPKNVPMQKNSHDCCVLEALFKDSRVQNASHFMKNRPPLQGVRRRSVTGR